MKKIGSLFLAALLLTSCMAEFPSEKDSTTTASPDAAGSSISSAFESISDSESALPSDPAELFNEKIREESVAIRGYFPDTDVWAYEFAAAVLPGEISSEDLFVHEKGASTSGYSESYDVGYTIWSCGDIRVLLVYVIEDDLYTLSYAALLDTGFTALDGRELCRILNEDGRFGDFVYPEPQSGDGVIAMNLTEISHNAIRKEFPAAKRISDIQSQIVGAFGDSVILLYYYYDIDGAAYPCSVTISLPSFIAEKKVTVTPGWPDDTGHLASESMIYGNWSVKYNDDGDLLLHSLDDEVERLIDCCVSGEDIPVSDYHVPRFWKFTEDGRMLYHVYGYEDYIGLGCYDIETGGNVIYYCHAPYDMKGNTIFATSEYYESEFKLYRLILNDEECIEQEIILPAGVVSEMPTYVIIDEGHAAFVVQDEEGEYRVVLVEIDGVETAVIGTYSFESKVASAQYPHVFGDYLMILCERHAMADEYAFAIPLDFQS